MPTEAHLRALLRHQVDFVVGEAPAQSRFVFRVPTGDVEATATEAIGPLSQGIRAMNADPSVRSWATLAILALRLMTNGHLLEPDPHERSQLQDAARTLDVDPRAAQSKAQAFLAALAVDAPAVATRGRASAPPAPTPQPRRPRRLSGTLHVHLLDLTHVEAADTSDVCVASITLTIKPHDTSWGEVPISDLWARDSHHFGAGAKQAVRTLVSHASQIWGPAARLLTEDGPAALELTEAELVELSQSTISSGLRALDVVVQWPDSVHQDLTARAVVGRVDSATSSMPRIFTSDSLFRFDWRISLGDEALTEDELEHLRRSSQRLVRLRNQWVFVDPQNVQRMLWNPGREISAAQALRAAASGQLVIDGETTQVDTVGWLDTLRHKLASTPSDLHDVQQPEALRGSLRHYQLDGMRWLNQLIGLGLGGCLADDMGLGKTVMVIALHLHRKASGDTGPTLVVCPASVVGNWIDEIRRFAPGEPVRRYHATDRDLYGLSDGFVVTTFATMRRDIVELRDVRWNLVIADEAQNVKNVRSGAATALRELPAAHRIALTGTPVENNLGELWAILDWTTPGLLDTQQEFRRRWSRPIERHADSDRAKDLATLIRPFVLRRRKSDPGIAPELPEKIETDHSVGLTREQVGLYQAVVRATMSEIEAADGIQRRGLIIKLLTQLKQICNHPAQFLRDMDADLPRRSAKLDRLDELLDEALTGDSSVLIFSQYARMGALLHRHLSSRGLSSAFLYGATPVRQREKMVREFQQGDIRVFVLSLKAAGTGLNLTRADHVVHYDRWWNPAVEDQATDRAHRLGQERVVQVHRLISRGTIEDAVSELITSKRALADAVVNSGPAALTELTDSEIAHLVRLRLDPADI